jgi:hypothetical protein
VRALLLDILKRAVLNLVTPDREAQSELGNPPAMKIKPNTNGESKLYARLWLKLKKIRLWPTSAEISICG